MADFSALMRMAKSHTTSLQVSVASKESERLAKEAKQRADEERLERLQKERDRKEMEKRLKEKEEREKREKAAREEMARRLREKKKEEAEAEARDQKKHLAAPRSKARSKSPDSAPSTSRVYLSLEEKRKLAALREMEADSDDEGGRARHKIQASTSTAIRRNPALSRAVNGSDRSRSASPARRWQQKAKGSGPTAAARSLGFDPMQLVALNTEKRDLRTIDEIERDYRLRKQAEAESAGQSKPAGGLLASLKGGEKGKGKDATPASSAPPTNGTSASVGSTSKSAPNTPLQAGTTSLQFVTNKRSLALDKDERDSKRPKVAEDAGLKKPSQVAAGKNKAPLQVAKSSALMPNKVVKSPSTSSAHLKETSSASFKKPGSGRGRSPPRNSSSRKTRYDSDGDDAFHNPSAISAEIQAIFGRGRPKRAYSEDEYDSDDMEVGFDEVLKEDARAARLARKEDEEEERRLQKYAEEKARRKAMTTKG